MSVEFKEISAAEVPPGGSQPPYFGHAPEDDPEQEQFLQDLGRELEELESLPPAPALSPAATALPSLPPPPPACAMEELPECLAPPAPVVPVEALLPPTVASRVEQPSSLPVFGSQLSCAELPAQRAPVESAPSQSVSGLLEPPQKASVEALPSQLVSGVPEPPAPHAVMEPPALPKSAAVVAGAKSHAPSQAQKLVQSQASPQASTRTLPPLEEIPWSNVTAQGLSNLFRVPVSSLKKNSSFARLDSQETLAYACDTPSKIRRTSSPPPLQRLWSMQSLGNASVSSDASEAANATGSVSEAEIGAPTPVRLPSQDAAEDDADLVEARLAIMLEALKEARMAKRKLSSQELNASTSSGSLGGSPANLHSPQSATSAPRTAALPTANPNATPDGLVPSQAPQHAVSPLPATPSPHGSLQNPGEAAVRALPAVSADLCGHVSPGHSQHVASNPPKGAPMIPESASAPPVPNSATQTPAVPAMIPTPSTTFLALPPPPGDQGLRPSFPPTAAPVTPVAPPPVPPTVAPVCPPETGNGEPLKCNSKSHAKEYVALKRFAENDCNQNSDLAKAWKTLSQQNGIPVSLHLGQN